jgi:hypothetical protein
MLHGCRFVEDLAVSGPVVWNRTTKVVEARVRLQGPGRLRGSLNVRWRTGVGDSGDPETVSGEFGGQHVDVALPAAWVPQS